MKLLFISSVLAIATSAVAADVKFLRTANRSGKCDWETGSSTRAASSGDGCDELGDSCTGGPGRGSCCTGSGLTCNPPENVCTHNGDAKDTAAAFEKELKLVEEEDQTCMPQDASGGEGKCGCKTGPTGGNPHGTPCCSGSTCNGVSKDGEATFTCEPPTAVETLAADSPLSQCSWYTGSSTRAASSGDDCDELGEPCTGPGRGSCCTGGGLTCNPPENVCTINGDAKDTTAAFEKELKLVEEEAQVCIDDGEGGPGGKCGCKAVNGGNPDGTPCCGNMVCSYVRSTHAETRGIEAGFYCSVPGEEDVAVEIN